MKQYKGIKMEAIDEIKKKRGRKPKPKEIIDESIAAQIKTIKKRGRKPTGKVIELSRPTVINQENNDVLMVHLPLNDEDISEESDDEILPPSKPQMISFDDDFVEPIVPICECSTLKAKIMELEDALVQANKGSVRHTSLREKRLITCDMDMVDVSGKLPVWREASNVACWWDGHKFDTIPLGMPDSYYNGTFYTVGCFCSLDCMMAYNVDIGDSRIGERTTLINKLNKILFGATHGFIPEIPRAGPWQMLALYGGEQSIDEFRAANASITKEYRLLLPPMTSLVVTVEEGTKDSSNKYSLAASKKKKLGTGKLVLQRTKPLPNASILSCIMKTI